MSKYTTEVRYICESFAGLDKSAMYPSVNDVINKAKDKVFDFSFPIFDETYRGVLETKILKHYYTREISEESVGLWKLRLDTKLNEIMPYYNKLYESELYTFNPLYSEDLTRTRNIAGSNATLDVERIEDVNTHSGTDNGNTSSSVTTDGTSSGTNENTNTDLYSDTPQGSLSGVSSNNYLTNARKVTDNASSSGTQHSVNVSELVSNGSNSSNGTYNRDKTLNGQVSTTEEYIESVAGYTGTNPSEAIMKYRESLLNIDMMVIGELENLFFNLW